MAFAAGPEELARFIPEVVGSHALRVFLIGLPINNAVDPGHFWVVEGFSIPMIGLADGVFEQYDNALHASGWGVDVDRERRIAFVFRDPSIAVYAVVQDGQLTGILVRDHPGELGVGDNVKLEVDIHDAVASSSITRRLDHFVVPVRIYIELELVAKGCLVKGHVALEQLKVERDVNATPIRICNGTFDQRLHTICSTNPKFCGIPKGPHVDALVVCVAPLPGSLPQVEVRVVDVEIVKAEYLFA